MMLRKRSHRKKDRNLGNQSTRLFFISVLLIVLVFFGSSIFKERWTFDWRNINTEIRDTVFKIEESGIIAFESRRNLEVVQAQANRRSWLFSNATNDELLRLTKYPDATVKLAAYEGLIRNRYNLFHVLNTALDDTTTFAEVSYGCLFQTKLLSECLIEDVLSVWDIPKFLDKIGLTDEESNQIILKYDTRLDNKMDYLKNWYLY